MPHKQDDDLEFGGENRATNNLARAIRQLVEVQEKLLCHLQGNTATRNDVLEAEGRLTSAFSSGTDKVLQALGERVDPAAVKELKEASGELKAAVKANTPVSGP